MSKRMFQVTAAALVVLSISSLHAQSGSARCRFTTLVDSQSGLFPASCPAINTFGAVAVVVRVQDPFFGPQVLITKRGANDSPVVIAHTQEIANFPRSATTASTSSHPTHRSTTSVKWLPAESR